VLGVSLQQEFGKESIQLGCREKIHIRAGVGITLVSKPCVSLSLVATPQAQLSEFSHGKVIRLTEFRHTQSYMRYL